MRYFKFFEPHITGGTAQVTITDEQIIKHMNEIKKETVILKDATDAKLLADFIAVHWCTEINITDDEQTHFNTGH